MSVSSKSKVSVSSCKTGRSCGGCAKSGRSKGEVDLCSCAHLRTSSKAKSTSKSKK